MNFFSKKLGFALGSRIWQTLSGPITIFLIAESFSSEEQGYYYTFGSLVGLQIFLEMGLSFVLAQHTSHLFAHLTWGTGGGPEGDKETRKEFLKFLYSAIKWYGIMTIVFLGSLLPGGFYFLGQHPSPNGISWAFPWFFLVCTSSLNLFITPILAVIEGSGRVQEIARVRLVQGITGSLISWSVLFLGGGLYVIGTNVLVSAFIGIVWMIWKNPRLVQSLLSFREKHRKDPSSFSWKKEIWPMQWRIGISWMSGYFINQLFTPILFHYYGAKSAGRMGMSLSLVNMLGTIAVTWISIQMPTFGLLIAQKNWKELDRIFFKAFRESLAVILLGAMSIVIFFELIQSLGLSIRSRFLPPLQIDLLLGVVILNHITVVLALYLRAHKREPFVWLSLSGAILMGLSTWILGKNFGSLGVLAGALLINILFGVPTSAALWFRLRSLWHR